MKEDRLGEVQDIQVSFIVAGIIAAAAASLAYGWATLSRPLAVEGGGAGGGRSTPARTATALGWLTGLALVAAGTLRAVEAGRPPLGSMFEYLTVLAGAIVVTYLFIERRAGERGVGAVVLPGVLLLLIVTLLLFPTRLEPLVPALQNNRLLALHVAAMLIAYSALAVAFAAALIYLVQLPGDRWRRLPRSDVAERVQHMAILVGFPLLGLGIVLGAYWAHHAWGRYWGWDPKETTALASWLIYAGYLHAFALSGWRGARTSLLAVTGFAVIVFNIFVVNFVISGLHSYAGG